jgi:hypothetical protein
MSKNTKTKQLLISTLACLLQNGISWIRSCFRIISGDPPLSVFLAKPDEFRRAVTSCENAARVGFEIPSSLDDVSDEKEKLISTWVQIEAYQEVTSMILQFAAHILSRSLPVGAAALEMYDTYILSTPQENYVTLLTRQNMKSHMAIPKVLLDDKFFALSRMWFLEPISEDTPPRYSLVDKRKIYGPSLSGNVQWQKMARVCGPAVEDSDVESSEEDEVDPATT